MGLLGSHFVKRAMADLLSVYGSARDRGFGNSAYLFWSNGGFTNLELEWSKIRISIYFGLMVYLLILNWNGPKL